MQFYILPMFLSPINFIYLINPFGGNIQSNAREFHLSYKRC